MTVAREFAIRTADVGQRLEAWSRIPPTTTLTAVTLLGIIDNPSWSIARILNLFRHISEADAERHLLVRIEACGKRLGLPAVLAQAAGNSAAPTISLRDSLEIVTILSKTSGGVYLADRVPNLHLAFKARKVQLLVPAGWSRP